MKYAIIKTGGKQYKVKEGDALEVEKLMVRQAHQASKLIDFNEVLLVVEDKNVLIGQPLVEGAKVKAKVLGHLKGPKIRVAKFRAKSRYRKVKGHRQEKTRVKIQKIEIVKEGKGSEKEKGKKGNL